MTKTVLPKRRLDINSLQAIASVEETQAQFRGSELHTLLRVPVGPRLSAAVLLRACRPRQWSKNMLVLAAPCAAGAVTRPQVALEAVAAFVVFCLLSSAAYLINDVRDREQDRHHPRKRTRPVAAGELSPRAAVGAATIMGLTGVVTATAVSPALGADCCGYL